MKMKNWFAACDGCVCVWGGGYFPGPQYTSVFFIWVMGDWKTERRNEILIRKHAATTAVCSGLTLVIT